MILLIIFIVHGIKFNYFRGRLVHKAQLGRKNKGAAKLVILTIFKNGALVFLYGLFRASFIFPEDEKTAFNILFMTIYILSTKGLRH